MITPFQYKNPLHSDPTFNRTTIHSSSNRTAQNSKILSFSAATEAQREQQQYEQAKQAINQAASSLNW